MSCIHEIYINRDRQIDKNGLQGTWVPKNMAQWICLGFRPTLLIHKKMNATWGTHDLNMLETYTPYDTTWGLSWHTVAGCSKIWSLKTDLRKVMLLLVSDWFPERLVLACSEPLVFSGAAISNVLVPWLPRDREHFLPGGSAVPREK